MLELNSMIFWNVVLTLIIAPAIWHFRNLMQEVKRLDILLNRTREDYATKLELRDDMQGVMDLLHRVEDKLDKVPAVLHFDGTARLQTVSEKDNKWYHGFISKWFKKSGVPIVLNTSFNDREPIVENPEHAINCYMGTNIDYLYFFDFGLLVKKVD